MFANKRPRDFNEHPFLFLVHSNECNNEIRPTGQQQESSIYCSSCSTYIDEKTSAPIIQLEMPSLTQLTGIFVQRYNENQGINSVCKKTRTLFRRFST